MYVHFISKKSGSTVIPCPEIGDKYDIRFDNGKYSTADKREIFKLLNDPYAQKYIDLTPGQDLEKIDDYISSEERPSTMDKKFLDAIPREAWKEILARKKELGVQYPLVEIAKAKLEGAPLDNEMEEILAEYSKTSRALTRELQRKHQEQAEVEEVEVPDDITSKDYNAKEAAEIIENSDASELEGFLHPEEDRVTVTRAWEEKFAVSEAQES